MVVIRLDTMFLVFYGIYVIFILFLIFIFYKVLNFELENIKLLFLGRVVGESFC